MEQPDVWTMSRDGTARCLDHVPWWNSRMFGPCPLMEQPDVWTMTCNGTARCLDHVPWWNSPMFGPCRSMEQPDVWTISWDRTARCLDHVTRSDSSMFGPSGCSTPERGPDIGLFHHGTWSKHRAVPLRDMVQTSGCSTPGHGPNIGLFHHGTWSIELPPCRLEVVSKQQLSDEFLDGFRAREETHCASFKWPCGHFWSWQRMARDFGTQPMRARISTVHHGWHYQRPWSRLRNLYVDLCVARWPRGLGTYIGLKLWDLPPKNITWTTQVRVPHAPIYLRAAPWQTIYKLIFLSVVVWPGDWRVQTMYIFPKIWDLTNVPPRGNLTYMYFAAG